MCAKRYMRILNAVDIYGEKFIPKCARYEVIYTHDKYVALGIDGQVLYLMHWEDVEDY